MPELSAPLASAATTRLLSRWLLLGEWRAHPVRAFVAILAIAIGVSLGFAIHLINAAAFNEFSTAVKSLSGQADVQVAGREALFDESIYPWLAQHDGVAVASPVLDLQAAVARKKDGGPLHILALDVFRAGFISPDLIGAPAEGQPFDTLADDALFLSPAALRWLGVAQGDTIALQSGTGQVPLRVAGSLQRARAGQRIAVMDIGAAQWRFNKLGKLSRIDLKLRQGVNRDAFQADLARTLEARYRGGFGVGRRNSQDQNTRNSNGSAATRLNLTVLALVALFTGAFLVFSTQALSVIRRRGQFA